MGPERTDTTDRDVAELVAELARKTPSSIEVQRAKDGTYYWTIKCYYEEGEQQDAVLRLNNIDVALRLLYLPPAEQGR